MKPYKIINDIYYFKKGESEMTVEVKADGKYIITGDVIVDDCIEIGEYKIQIKDYE